MTESNGRTWYVFVNSLAHIDTRGGPRFELYFERPNEREPNSQGALYRALPRAEVMFQADYIMRSDGVFCKSREFACGANSPVEVAYRAELFVAAAGLLAK